MPALIETVRGVGYRLVDAGRPLSPRTARCAPDCCRCSSSCSRSSWSRSASRCALSVAHAQQQRVVVDRIDDTARFAALAQFVTAPDGNGAGTDSTDTANSTERLTTLEEELTRYSDPVRDQGGRLLPRRQRHGERPRRLARARQGPGVRRLPGSPRGTPQPRPRPGVALAAGPPRGRVARRTRRRRHRGRRHGLAHRQHAFGASCTAGCSSWPANWRRCCSRSARRSV